MVVFTCNHCGETLQKPRVAKHYQFQCRGAPFLTCVDCFKDFRGEEYVAHTKCITEAERYGGKDYVPKASANKGEKKQQEWINVVNNLLESSTNLSNAERGFLTTLSKFNNIPRKKAKFLNFVRSAMGNRMNMNIVEGAWSKMEAAQKSSGPDTTNNKQQNGKVKGEENGRQLKEESAVEKQNNENIERENEGEVEKNEDNKAINNIKEAKDTVSSKKRKSAKGLITEITEAETVESAPKKKKKSTILSESSVNQAEEPSETPSFDWKCTIINIVENKGELSLKKLQKKVISQYMGHCGDAVSYEKASSKFNKKLKKLAEVVVSDGRVKLT